MIEHRTGHFELLTYGFRRCAAVRFTGFHTGFKSDFVADVFFDLVVKALIFIHCQIIEALVMLDAVVDHGTDNMVRFTERHAFTSQVVGQVCGVGITQIGVVAHFFQR